MSCTEVRRQCRDDGLARAAPPMFGDRDDSGDPHFELLKLRLELREPKRQLFELASFGEGSAEAFALWKMIALHELRQFRLGEWRQVSEGSTPGLAGG